MKRGFAAFAALCFALLYSSPFPAQAAPPSGSAVAAGRGDASAPAQLDALAGEYTNRVEPDTPLSFYVQGGKLTVESERMVPTKMEAFSATEFGIRHSRAYFSFTLDAKGRGASVTFSAEPGAVYQRTGPPVHHVFHDYRRTEAIIPMRDGVKLHAVILKPADITTPLPILMQRTPYGVDGTTRASFFADRPELARDGYIYVAEDIRGRFESHGKFVMMRPLADHHNPKAIDESTDTYDTVAWLIKHVPGNNGRVGVVGTSYPGFLAMMAGIDPNPAVKAISPQAPMIDVWKGDDFFHNGAFRQSYGYDYVLMMESSKKNSSVSYGRNKDGGPMDGYNFFLERGSFAQDVKESGSKLLPTWQLFLDHPSYDIDWRSRAVEYHLNTVAVPTLTVGGYYDQEDMYGPQEEYSKLEPHDRHRDNFLALGPWRHGSWASSTRHLGNLDYGQPIGKEFRARIEARFFAHYLKGQPGFMLQNTASFQTGSNTWQYYAQFPPRRSRLASLYLDGNGQLSWSGSTAQARTSYVSDPANPVPYRHRPIQPTYGRGSQWYDWLAEDQRFVTGRKDVAVWKLPVLKHDLTLTGEVVADVYASTTGSDSDMVVKLIDEYPDNDPDPTMRGYQLMTNEEIFRGRYLSGFDNPAALKPGSIYAYKFSLHDVDHVFKAGHTVMVEIQSTWFPLYDRNPQTFVPNIMTAKPEDYKAETITIYSGPGHESSLQVPVMKP
ncbi:MAG: CocE/NonD family hydrolase [Acidobacteriota bacterium]